MGNQEYGLFRAFLFFLIPCGRYGRFMVSLTGPKLSEFLLNVKLVNSPFKRGFPFTREINFSHLCILQDNLKTRYLYEIRHVHCWDLGKKVLFLSGPVTRGGEG